MSTRRERSVMVSDDAVRYARQLISDFGIDGCERAFIMMKACAYVSTHTIPRFYRGDYNRWLIDKCVSMILDTL